MPSRLLLVAAATVPIFSVQFSAADELESRAKVEPPKIVTAEEWGSTPDVIKDDRRHTPKYVTLHHAGVLWTTANDPVEFLRNMQAWGKRRPDLEQPPRNTSWPDLPYHYLIAPDGRVFEGRSERYEPESNTKYDLAGHLGVELMGNFEEQRPSQQQVESAVRLVAWLLAKHKLPLASVRTHQQVAQGQTSCPGRDFARYFDADVGQFRQWIGTVLAGGELDIDLGSPLVDGPTQLITETGPKHD